MFHFTSHRRATLAVVLGAAYAFACSGNIDSSTPPEQEPVTPPVTEPEPVDDPVALPDDPAPEPPKPLLQAQVEDILNRTCGECHGANGRREAGMNYIEDLDQLANNGKIVPGRADESPIVVRIRNGTMPPPNYAPPTPDEIEQIAQFIDVWEGPADAPPRVCDGQEIRFDDIYDAILTDLLLLDGDDREFTRYVGITNRYNAGQCDDRLEVERWSLTKLLNSLSTETRIREPVAIDDARLIFRIDIRDYGWDRDVDFGGVNANDGWEAIIAETPMAVPFVGDEADNIALFAETAVPYLYADALASVASVGELYYALVDIPESVDELLDDLRIDAQQNLDQGRVARAGTRNSGVSREDRLVERHEVGIGAGRVYWQAFEFDGNADLFLEPIDFEAAGSEAIFSLPNGLHGYAIFDEDGNTIEESDLLFDTLQGNFPVTSAVSCMTCHSRGFLQVRDEVREFANGNVLDLNRDEIELVQEIYPSIDEMDQIVSDDRRLYQSALQQAGVPINVADPVSNVFFRYEDSVSLADAAGDLGVTPDFLDRNLNRLDVQLRLLRSGLKLRRRNFENVYAETLCRLQIASQNRPDEIECNL